MTKALVLLLKAYGKLFQMKDATLEGMFNDIVIAAFICNINQVAS